MAASVITPLHGDVIGVRAAASYGRVRAVTLESGDGQLSRSFRESRLRSHESPRQNAYTVLAPAIMPLPQRPESQHMTLCECRTVQGRCEFCTAARLASMQPGLSFWRPLSPKGLPGSGDLAGRSHLRRDAPDPAPVSGN